jgi:phenylacetate-CoA ligase
MNREDLATRLAEIVPRDADLDRVIAYDTSGTTGHAVDVPTHPLTLAMAHVFAEYALAAYGILPKFGPDMVACFNVCAQQSTYVFANVFSVWNQAGFAKVNLRESEWPGGREGTLRFFEELAPAFITADPVALAEMTQWALSIAPAAIFSTAVTLSPGLAKIVGDQYGCPVIDWYSTTETGPIAFTAPDGKGLQLLAPDLFVEIVDPQGFPVLDGEWGEITVTGGRNPYLPLLRYRTGDRGRMQAGRIVELDGREAVFFRAHDGSTVNPVDIARILRLHYAFVQHEFVQFKDGACRMTIRPAPHTRLDLEHMDALLREVFGKDQPLELIIDDQLGADGRKVIPYRSELLPGLALPSTTGPRPHELARSAPRNSR